MNLEKTIKNLELRHFKVSHFASGTEAADYLAQALQGQTVGLIPLLGHTHPSFAAWYAAKGTNMPGGESPLTMRA